VFLKKYLETARNFPSMNDISAVGRLPLGGLTGVVAFQFDGKPTSLADSPISVVNHAVPAYFNTAFATKERKNTDANPRY
jgi:hypothetical protein